MIVRSVDVRARLQEQVDDFGVALVHGPRQRSRSVAERRVDVSARLEERSHGRPVLPSNRLEERLGRRGSVRSTHQHCHRRQREKNRRERASYAHP